MSTDLRNMMASRYPTASQPIKSPPMIEHKHQDTNRALLVAVVLGIIFLLLSLPQTYEIISKFLSHEKSHSVQLVAINSVLFTAVAYLVIKNSAI
jgi:hypothetical protein